MWLWEKPFFKEGSITVFDANIPYKLQHTILTYIHVQPSYDQHATFFAFYSFCHAEKTLTGLNIEF